MDIHAIRRANLQRLIDERFDGVQARLAHAIRRPANYVWRLLSDGPHAKSLGEELARAIEEATGVPRYWLDDQARIVLNHKHNKDNSVDSDAGGGGAPPARGRLPVFSVPEIARTVADVTGQRQVAAMTTDNEYDDRAFGLIVSGQSMFPDLMEGERLVFDPGEAPLAGDIVLASVDGRALVRRYRPQDTAGAYELVAANPDYAPVWSDRARVSILAVMVEHHRLRRTRLPH